MSKRHTAEFDDDRGNRFRVEIWDTEHSTADTPLQLAGGGFELEWDGDIDNPFCGVIASSCSVDFLDIDTNSAGLLSDMYQASEGRFTLRIYRQRPGASSILYWSGVVLLDHDRRDEPYERFTVHASDDLANLSTQNYVQASGAEYGDQALLPTVVARCLSKCRHLDAWGASDNFLLISDSREHADHVQAPYITRIGFNSAKLRNPDGDGVPRYYTARQVLDNVLLNLGAVLYQCDGAWFVENVASRADTIKDFRTFQKDGTNGNGSVFTGHNLQTFQATAQARFLTANDDQDRIKIAGWTGGQLPPLSEVRTKYAYGGTGVDWNALVPSGSFDSNFWQTNNYGGADGIQTGDVVTLVFGYYLSIAGDPNATAGTGVRFKFELGYKHGTTFGTRPAVVAQQGGQTVTEDYTTNGQNVECFAINYGEAEYTATTSARIEWWSAAFDASIGSNLAGTVAVTFPAYAGAVPVTTEVGALKAQLFNAAGSAVGYLSTPVALTFIYQTQGAAQVNGDVVEYARTSGDGNAREDLELDGAILADAVSPLFAGNLLNWFINDGSGYVAATPDWASPKYPGLSTAVLDLTCLEALSLRASSRDQWQGTLQAGGATMYQPIPSADHPGSGLLVPMRLIHHGQRAEFTVEGYVHEFDTGTDGNGPTGNSDRNSLRQAPSVRTGDTSGQEIQTNAQPILLGMLQDIEGLQTQATATAKKSKAVDLKADALEARVGTAGSKSTISVDELADVSTTAPTDGQVLKFNNATSEWEPADDETGGSGSVAFADLTDVNPSLSPQPGDLLNWTTVNGGQWNSTTAALAVGSQIDAGNLGNVSEGTGTLGNILVDFNLAGPYWITQTPSQWAGTHLPIGSLSNVAGTTPTAGDLLQWSGTQWEPVAPFTYITLQSSFYSADGNGDYIPIGGTLSETTASTYYNIWTAPAAGEVIKATCICQATTAGSTVLSIRKYPIPQSIGSDTQTFNTVYGTGTFTFTGATFNAGDRLQFYFDPTGRPNGVQVTLLLKILHP